MTHFSHPISLTAYSVTPLPLQESFPDLCALQEARAAEHRADLKEQKRAAMQEEKQKRLEAEEASRLRSYE